MQVENISTGRLYDLTNCDREPIHIPGSVQPHGFLFALTEPALEVEQLSSNAATYLGEEPSEILGRALDALFTEESMNSMRGALTSPDAKANNPLALQFRGRAERYSGILHRYQDTLILEMEPALGGDAAERLDRYNRTRAAISSLRGTKTLDELCDVACHRIRELTGFDRVVVYYFDRDWNGAVIAEARSAEAESFFGLHFPASDIPRQARELYRLNWLRLIPTVDYQPAPIYPELNPRTGQSLDLSHSVLRSVSPVHVEYLKNMGLSASMSVSLMKGNELWGLISCAALHGKRFIPFETRASCEFIAEVMSSLLAEKTQLEGFDEKMQSRRLHDRLVSTLAQQDDLLSALAGEEKSLLDLMRANGAAISFRGNVALLGKAPPLSRVKGLIEWLGARGADTFETDSLKRDYPEWGDLVRSHSGLLAVRLSKASTDQYLLWFRPEVAQAVTWGGTPISPPRPMGSVCTRVNRLPSGKKWCVRNPCPGGPMKWRMPGIFNGRYPRSCLAAPKD